MLAIAADTGGTFTDFVALSADGQLRFAKALTTYDAPMRGLMHCVERADIDLAQADSLKFGTTLVINALLQRNGAKVSMLCTRGFRDTLEIRRGNRVDPFDLRYARDPLLVPRARRYEASERISAFGEIMQPLDLDDVAAVAGRIRADGAEAVAIVLLNAYANDAHERQAAALLTALLPGVYVTTGSDLTREYYEYERASTAAANAYVGPILHGFLDHMETTLAQAGFVKARYLMASSGGMFSLDEARRQPIQLVESGPVGGCIGAAAYAQALGLAKVIAFDMGGTTAKCALVENHAFETRSPYYVGGVERGFPIRGAVVDIIEVGAGGGSIARLDAFGGLSVGPLSAGSTPGPACYGRGGQNPTITDANVILGRIGVASFLGGEMQLDLAAAQRAMLEQVALGMGYDPAQLDQVAQGVIDIATLTMSSALAKITTERGLDPRDFALFVFGGGGPVHGVDLARHMGIPTVIVPPHPGVFSAVGMLLAQARADEARTFFQPLNAASVAAMLTEFADMEAVAAVRLPQPANPAGPPLGTRHAEIRYKGQRHALKLGLGDAASPASIRERFLHAYRNRFGHGDGDLPLEFVGLAVTVTQQMDNFTPASMIGLTEIDGPAPEPREVFFRRAGRRVMTPVVQRRHLAIGATRNGPLIVEEYGSSTIIGPGDHVLVGGLGELNITVGA